METIYSTKDHQPLADACSKTYTCFACPKTYSSISRLRGHLNKKKNMPWNGVNIFSSQCEKTCFRDLNSTDPRRPIWAFVIRLSELASNEILIFQLVSIAVSLSKLVWISLSETPKNMWACSKIMKLFTLWHPMHTFAYILRTKHS